MNKLDVLLKIVDGNMLDLWIYYNLNCYKEFKELEPKEKYLLLDCVKDAYSKVDTTIDICKIVDIMMQEDWYNNIINGYAWSNDLEELLYANME